jgi:small-conductance mechanosensitive channel
MELPDALTDLSGREKLLVGLRASMLLLGALVVVPMLRRTVRRFSKDRLQPHQQMLLLRAISWVGYGLAISCTLTALGFDLGVLLGAAGVFTVAIGFAAQTSVSNLVSGIFLLIEQPFVVGDQIQSNGVTGEILSVDLLSVKLRTPEKVFVRLPNELLLKSAVTNLTRFDVAGSTLEFCVAADQPLDEVPSLLRELATGTDLVLKTPAPIVGCLGYTDAGVTFTLMIWAPRLELGNVKVSLFIRGLATLQAAKVALPAPRRRVSQA